MRRLGSPAYFATSTVNRSARHANRSRCRRSCTSLLEDRRTTVHLTVKLYRTVSGLLRKGEVRLPIQLHCRWVQPSVEDVSRALTAFHHPYHRRNRATRLAHKTPAQRRAERLSRRRQQHHFPPTTPRGHNWEEVVPGSSCGMLPPESSATRLSPPHAFVKP